MKGVWFPNDNHAGIFGTKCLYIHNLPSAVLMMDFFISYNQADRSWAEWIAWQLEEAGYSTINQFWDFRPGSNFVEKMQRATVEAERTIAIVSPDYLSSEFARSEWDTAFANDPLGIEGKLVPVKVKDCELDGLKKVIIHIDLRRLDEQAAKEALIKGVVRARVKPETEPVFPGKSQKKLINRPKFPGVPPEVCNLPLSQNLNFTGREQILAELKAALTSNLHGAWKLALYGMSGVGKTQITVEYAYRNMIDYRVVWWVRSEKSAMLASDYVLLAAELGLPKKDLMDQIKTVRIWLERNSHWLLIFDDAANPEDLEEFLPRFTEGHVIITSRNPNWSGIANSREIQVFNENESKEFMQKRTTRRDDLAASELSQELAYLPLALEQAGAYIEEKDISFSAYLERFRKHKMTVLERGKPREYKYTIATSLEISFQEVQQVSHAAASLLNLCSFLGAEDIPMSLLRERANGLLPLSLLANELEYDDAVAALRRYSLINTNCDNLSVHKLVQEANIARLTNEDQKMWSEIALTLLNCAFSYDGEDVKSWNDYLRLLRHAQSAASHADRLNIMPNETSQLFKRIGLFLKDNNEFKEAEKCFERGLVNAYKIKATEYDLDGEYPPDYKIDFNVLELNRNLGYVQLSLDNVKDAKEKLEKSLELDTSLYGPNHPIIAEDLNNVGSVYKKLGLLGKARKNFEAALVIDKKEYGDWHSCVARDLTNIGLVMQEFRDFDGASKKFKQALVIDKKFHGIEHPKVARDANNLGLAQKEQGNLQKAKKWFKLALEINKKFYGPDHQITKVVLRNMESYNR